MHVSDKLKILDQIHQIYETFSSGLRFACTRGCAACCTQNVIMTTLEGYRIVEHVISTKQEHLLQRLNDIGHQNRLRPAVTTNELADLCMQGKDTPEEGDNLPLLACPFLADKECLVYPARPFGCRCFFSTQKCDETSCAVVEPFLVSVNTAFLQFIEHVDVGGLFGNMTDVLLFLQSQNSRKQYEANAILNHPPELSKNRSIPALLVPPEHRDRIEPLLQKIRNIRLD